MRRDFRWGREVELLWGDAMRKCDVRVEGLLPSPSCRHRDRPSEGKCDDREAARSKNSVLLAPRNSRAFFYPSWGMGGLTGGLLG